MSAPEPQAIALSADIRAGDVHPVKLDGSEFVLWRDHSGKAHLWEDRCPHRGMRLSFGFVKRNRLTCIYHGWQFDADGGCQKIPAHPDINPPPTLCAATLEVEERLGMIFTGSPAIGEPDIGGHWHPARSVCLGCSAEEAIASLPDLPGAPFRTSGAAYVSLDLMFACAVQRRNRGQSALHLSTRNSDPAARLAAARRLLNLRRRLNAEPDA